MLLIDQSFKWWWRFERITLSTKINTLNRMKASMNALNHSRYKGDFCIEKWNLIMCHIGRTVPKCVKYETSSMQTLGGDIHWSPTLLTGGDFLTSKFVSQSLAVHLSQSLLSLYIFDFYQKENYTWITEIQIWNIQIYKRLYYTCTQTSHCSSEVPMTHFAFLNNILHFSLSSLLSPSILMMCHMCKSSNFLPRKGRISMFDEVFEGIDVGKWDNKRWSKTKWIIMTSGETM